MDIVAYNEARKVRWGKNFFRSQKVDCYFLSYNGCVQIFLSPYTLNAKSFSSSVLIPSYIDFSASNGFFPGLAS